MRNRTLLLVCVMQISCMSSLASTPIQVPLNQTVNIRNDCVSEKFYMGIGGGNKLELNVDSQALSFKIEPKNHAGLGQSLRIFCGNSPVYRLDLIASIPDLVPQNRYSSYKSGEKLYIPDLYIKTGQMIKYNGVPIKVLEDSRGKFIELPPGILKSVSKIEDSKTGVVVTVSSNSEKELLVSSKDDYENLGDLIKSESGGYKNLDKDWINVSMKRLLKLPAPRQGNKICGNYIYSLQNLNYEQSASLINGSRPSGIPVNPIGSLWPTGLMNSKAAIVVGNYSNLKILVNINDRHAKYSKNRVVVHILDTASNYLDDFSMTFGSNTIYDHGSVIGKVIERIISESGFGDDIFINYIDVCDDSQCDPVRIIRNICEIAQEAKKEKGKLHIINLSMASSLPQDFLRLAIEDAVSANVAVVYAAGNKTSCTPKYEVSEKSCLLFPADSFNISGFSSEVSRQKYISTMSSSGLNNLNLYYRGVYSVASSYGNRPDGSINRIRPSDGPADGIERSNIPAIYAPSAYYDEATSSLYAGTSFSAGYFTAALAMYRSCDTQKRIGPGIFKDNWAKTMSGTPSLNLDIDKMLAGICY